MVPSLGEHPSLVFAGLSEHKGKQAFTYKLSAFVYKPSGLCLISVKQEFNRYHSGPYTYAFIFTSESIFSSKDFTPGSDAMLGKNLLMLSLPL